MVGFSVLSPQSTFSRGMTLIARDSAPLATALAVTFIVPYPILVFAYGEYFRVEHLPHAGPIYFINHYGYLLAVGLLDQLRFCAIAQIIYDRGNGTPRSELAVLKVAFANWLRSLWFMAPASLTAYFLYEKMWVLTLPLYFVWDTFSFGYVLERKSAFASFTGIGRLLKGQILTLCSTFTLMWLLAMGVSKLGIHNLGSWLHPYMPWYVHALVMTPIDALFALIWAAWEIAIFLAARHLSVQAPARTADIFS